MPPQSYRPLRRGVLPLFFPLVAAAVVTFCACDRGGPPAAAPADGSPPRVASLVPAATDILLGLNASDRLVAVSNFDADPRVEGLPRVGDYQTIDWEQIAAAGAGVVVVQVAEDRLPTGTRERARRQKVEFVNVVLTRLDDIRQSVGRLAEVAGLDPDEARLVFERQLGEPKLARDTPRRVLVAVSADLRYLAGRGNYLDDLLAHAGGQNVLGSDAGPWPQVDAEWLTSLRPEAVVVLDAGWRAEEARAVVAAAGWEVDPEAVVVVSGPQALLPGWRVGEVTDAMRQAVTAAERRRAPRDD